MARRPDSHGERIDYPITARETQNAESHTQMTGKGRPETMSSRRAGALQRTFPDGHHGPSSEVHPGTDVHHGRIQRKWTILLRRADARESALRSALAHARAEESQLRLQLEGERRRHATESNLLRERLRRIEQSFLHYIAAARGVLLSPSAARPESSGWSPGIGVPSAHGRLALAPGDISSPVTGTPAPAQLSAPAPFDPVATVASMLPLSRTHAGAPEADVEGALDRLQAVVGTLPARSDMDLSTPTPVGLSAAAPTAQAHAGAPTTGAHDEVLTTGAQDKAPSAEAHGGAPTAETHDEAPSAGAQDEHRDEQDKNLPARGERPSTEESIGIGASDTPWFPRAFRRLTEEDPEAAGRLFLQLLPAQRLVWPEDVAYRIEVAETGALAVDVSAGTSTVRPLLESGAPARAGEPTLRTDLAGLARAVAGRRGWSRVGARIAGSRSRHLRPLRALAAAPLQLSDLKRAGAHPDPVLLLRLLALAIDPEWTAEAVFTIACRWRGRVHSGCYIHVFERAPVAVTSLPPLGRVAATLSCDPTQMLDVLLGEIPLEHALAQVSGDRAAITSLLEWFRRVDATAITPPAVPVALAV
jgi:hypothetical protein